MRKRTKILWLIMTALLALSLVACSQNTNNSENNAANDQINDQVNDPANEDANEATPSDDGSNADEDTDHQNGVERADTQTITLLLEGMEEDKIATLHKGKGFSFYVFDIFSFDPETNRLSMDYDQQYYVDIVQLSPDYSLEQIRAEAEATLAELGEVEELTGDELANHAFEPSLYLVSRSSDLTNKIIVKEMDNTGYMFKFNLPHGEAIEGFSPHAYASLNTLVSE